MPGEEQHQDGPQKLTASSIPNLSKRPHTYALSPARPNGVLAVHLKELKIFNGDFLKLFDQYVINLYVRIIKGDCVKCSCVHIVKGIPCTLYLDDLKHFSIQVDPDPSSNASNIHIELVGFDRPDVHRIISRKDFGMHDIIKNLYSVDTFRFMRTEKGVADLETEFCFAYGCFGYGYSNQIENLPSSPIDLITHSMFCRLPPPLDRQNENIDVMACRPVPHPTFINFTEKAELVDMGLEFGSKTELINSKEPVVLVSKMKKRLHQIQTEYQKQTSRKKRLLYLRGLMKNDSLAQEESEEIHTKKNLRLKRRAATADTSDDIDSSSKASFGAQDQESELTVADMAAMLMAAPGLTSTRADRGRRKKQQPEQQQSEKQTEERKPVAPKEQYLRQRRGTQIIDSTDESFERFHKRYTQEKQGNVEEADVKPGENRGWSLVKWFFGKGTAFKSRGAVAPQIEAVEMKDVEITERKKASSEKQTEESGSHNAGFGKRDQDSTVQKEGTSNYILETSSTVHKKGNPVDEVPGPSNQEGHQNIFIREPISADAPTRRVKSTVLEAAKRFLNGSRKGNLDSNHLVAPRVMLTPPSPCPSSDSSYEDLAGSTD